MLVACACILKRWRHDVTPCGTLGGIVARFALTKLGTRQGFPTFSELAQRYRELYNGEL